MKRFFIIAISIFLLALISFILIKYIYIRNEDIKSISDVNTHSEIDKVEEVPTQVESIILDDDSITSEIDVISHLNQDKLPILYIDFGTDKNEVINKYGNPIYIDESNNIGYDFITDIKSLERVIFYFDDAEKLIGITVKISYDKNHYVNSEYFPSNILDFYIDKYSELYGQPFSAQNGVFIVWKYIDAFAILESWVVDDSISYSSFIKEYADEKGYRNIF